MNILAFPAAQCVRVLDLNVDLIHVQSHIFVCGVLNPVISEGLDFVWRVNLSALGLGTTVIFLSVTPNFEMHRNT